jgi:DNA polymerase elongation subunit (family B)
MTLKVFVDIETLPPDEAVLPSFEAKILPHILTKPAYKEYKLSKSKHRELDKHYRSLALKGEYGRVLCIGVILEKDGKEWRKGVFGYDIEKEELHLDERKTLRGFWGMMKEDFNPRYDLVIGHNVMDFDLPFIYKRSRILQVKPPVQLSFARYRNSPIYDTMKEWALWNFRERSISLVHLAELLGIDMTKTEGIDGSLVYDKFLADEHALISKYCLQDVQLTREVYNRLI